MKRIIWLLLFASFLFFQSTDSHGDNPTPELKPLPDVRLVDQDEHVIRLHELKGQYVFVSFLYTHCEMPQACPMTVTLAINLMKAWSQTHPDLPVKMLMVTLDPDRDSPAVLKKYAQKRRVDLSRFSFVTGDNASLGKLKSALNVEGGMREDGNFFHDSRSFLVNRELVPIRMFSHNEWKPEEVLQGL